MDVRSTPAWELSGELKGLRARLTQALRHPPESVGASAAWREMEARENAPPHVAEAKATAKGRAARDAERAFAEAARLADEERLAIWRPPFFAPREDRGSLLMAAADADNAEGIRWLLSWAPRGAWEANHAGERVNLLDGDEPLSIMTAGALDGHARRKSARHRTALMIAAENGRIHALRALLAAGANPEARSETGDAALMLAAKGGHAECAEALASVCQPGAKNAKGRTAAHFAAEGGNARVAALFCGEEAQAATDAAGWTPFMLAVDGGSLDIVHAWEPFAPLSHSSPRNENALTIAIGGGSRGSSPACLAFLVERMRARHPKEMEALGADWAWDAFATLLLCRSACGAAALISAGEALEATGFRCAPQPEGKKRPILHHALDGEAPDEALDWVLARCLAQDPAGARALGIEAMGISIGRKLPQKAARLLGRLDWTADELRQAVGAEEAPLAFAQEIVRKEAEAIARAARQGQEEAKRAADGEKPRVAGASRAPSRRL